MIHYTVQPGDTLSGIAARYGTTYPAIASANGIDNPNYIVAGETMVIPSGGNYAQWTPSPESSASSASSSVSSPQASSGPSGGLSDVPGMPSSLASCIAFRESTNGQLSSNVYGIIPASGYNVAGDSLAQQKQVAGEIYAQYGGAAWSADGCPGT